MLITHPTDISLQILSYLSLAELSPLHIVSHGWREFIDVNETPIYHRVAFELGFVSSPSESLYEARKRMTILAKVQGWKELCRKSLQLERNWAGQGQSSITVHNITTGGVFKVDEINGFLITMSTEHEIIVIDLVNDKILWGLSKGYVLGSIHYEYHHGYLVFSCSNGAIEVWRHSPDPGGPSLVSKSSRPTRAQHDAAVDATTRFGPPSRGHFKPWACIAQDSIPERRFIIHLVYPALAIATPDTIRIWDITTAELSQEINGIGTGAGDLAASLVLSMDIDDKYIIISGLWTIRVFSRIDGTLVYRHGCNFDEIPSLTVYKQHGDSHTGVILVPRALKVNHQYVPPSEIVSVHIWNNIFMVLLRRGTVVIVNKIDRVIRGEASLPDVSVHIQIPTFCQKAKHATFNGGRIAIACKSSMYVLSLRQGLKIASNYIPGPFPGLAVSRVLEFKKINGGMLQRRIQIMENKLFFTTQCNSPRLRLRSNRNEPELPLPERPVISPNNDAIGPPYFPDIGFPNQNPFSYRRSRRPPRIIPLYKFGIDDTDDDDGNDQLSPVLPDLQNLDGSEGSDGGYSSRDFFPPRTPVFCVDVSPL